MERNGGGSGGSCPNGSWSFEMEDVGGEIIDISPLVAISLLWPAARDTIYMVYDIHTCVCVGGGNIHFKCVTKHFSIFSIFYTRIHITNGGTKRPKVKMCCGAIFRTYINCVASSGGRGSCKVRMHECIGKAFSPQTHTRTLPCPSKGLEAAGALKQGAAYAAPSYVWLSSRNARQPRLGSLP